jgi:hypothetical protein
MNATIVAALIGGRSLFRKDQKGYNTTCTVSTERGLAGIEVTANNTTSMISIDKLHPLAENTADRF